MNSSDVRKTVLQMAHKGATAHVACAYSIVEILLVLYREFIRFDVQDPDWQGRDYVVLSKGHGVMAQYAILYHLGVLPYESIATYMQDGTKLRGLSEFDVPGIEVTSGSLGHGLSVAVGMALAGKRNHTDQRYYAVVGDGEMNEGSIWEALLFASHFSLDNLLVIVDANGYQAMGTTDEVLNLGNLCKKFTEFGFECREVDGHDEAALSGVIRELHSSSTGLPKAVVANTTKGKGVSYMENDNTWHYRRVTAEMHELALIELGQGEPL